jgi:hypothetical protein
LWHPRSQDFNSLHITNRAVAVQSLLISAAALNPIDSK